jgi:hypothetical protein
VRLQEFLVEETNTADVVKVCLAGLKDWLTVNRDGRGHTNHTVTGSGTQTADFGTIQQLAVAVSQPFTGLGAAHTGIRT